jgi:hypothetical protein
VSERIFSYTPAPSSIPRAQWERIAPVVRTLAVLAVAAGPYAAGDFMTALAQLTAWAEGQGMPLEPMVLLKQDTIERFALTKAQKANSKRNTLAVLRRASEALLMDQLGQRPPIRLSAKPDPVAPYTPADIAHWLIWAQSLTTGLQRRNAVMLLTLTLGCGLAVEDIADLRGRHIERGPSGRCFVHVPGRRARVVLCRYAYEDLLLTYAQDVGEDEWVFRPDWEARTSKHITSTWAERYARHVGRDSRETIQPQRLRTTWFVDLLDHEVHLAVILRASGLATLHSLTRYLQFTKPVSQERSDELMRGAA